jgi:hypothetical protein
MTEHAEKLRDARLRKQILATLHRARSSPQGGLSGRTLYDCVDGGAGFSQGFDGDDHAMGLVIDLCNANFVAGRVLPRRKMQRDGIDFRFFSITDLGSQLYLEAIPPHPLVEDERIMGER